MERLARTLVLIVVGLLALGTAAGCRQQSLREPDPFLTLEPEDGPAPAMAPEAKGFFKPNRLSGAWSGEAAEIEQSLGVPR